MRTIAESYRDEFYRWESIGRGEKVWSEYVTPEPYYVPFVQHGAFLRRPPTSDTGLRPNLWNRAKSWLNKEEEKEQEFFWADLLDEHLLPHAPSALLGGDPDLVLGTFYLHLPKGEKLDNSRFEQFLYSLGSLQYPVTFEIIAVETVISLQFSVSLSDAQLFYANFTAFHPEVELGFSEDNDLLGGMLAYSGHEILSRDLALEREFYYPCRGLKDFSVDPYQVIFAALSNISDDELLILQVMFQPCLNPWGKSVMNLVSDGEGKPFFQSRSEDLKAVHQKNAKPYFAATVRLSAIAPTVHRCRELLRPVAASYEQYSGENGFVLADREERDTATEATEIAYRITKRSGMLLNGNELLSLVHLPGPEIHAPTLRRFEPDAAEVPDELVRDEGLYIGVGVGSGGEAPVSLSINERLRHMHIIGASGVGKSTLITSSIVQDLEAGHGLALLDPHGDLVGDVLDHVPEHRMKDVVLFDPADEEFPIGFNMLGAKTEAEKNILASDFVAVIQRLSSSWGDNMTSILGNAVMAFLENTQEGTFLDLRKFLGDDDFRKQILETVTEPEVKYFWDYEYPMIKGSAQASLITRLGSFIRQKLLRNMVAQTGEKLDFSKVMDEKKIFLAPLAQGLIGEECSFLIGSTLVSKFYQTALARQEMAESDRVPFFLYLDEAHNFVTPSIDSILSGARKYGLGLVLAHQDLDQFRSRSPSTLSSVLTNAHTRICFKLGDQDARKLEEGFEHFEPKDLRKLGRGEAICRVGGSQNDFILNTPAPLPEDEDAIARKDTIREHSRKTYGTPKAEVQEALAVYYKPPPPKKKSAKKKVAKKVEAEDQEAEAKPKEKAQEAVAKDSPTEGERVEEAAKESASPSKEVTTQQQEEARSKMPLPSQETLEKAVPYESLKKGETSGRGGPVHRGIQIQIKQQASNMGLSAQIEAKLPGGNDAVDVLIQGRTKSIAIEVAYKNSVPYEVKNIAKCLPQDFSEIIVTSDDPVHLQEIQAAAKQEGFGKQLSRVKFLELSELSSFLSEFGASLDSTETQNLGYDVTTTFVSKSEDEVKERQNRINDAIAETLRKMSGEE